VRNPIDAFVLQRLERAGLQPSPQADRAILLRRVTLDLTGLPPTPLELDAFLADTSPTAYEKVVDRLLQSPRYGERMAFPWLEAAVEGGKGLSRVREGALCQLDEVVAVTRHQEATLFMSELQDH